MIYAKNNRALDGGRQPNGASFIFTLPLAKIDPE